MQVHRQQEPPEIDDAGSIQIQLFDGGPSCRSEAKYQRVVFVPGEMVAPDILPRMEERNDLTADWVFRPDANELSIVAPLASKRQVGQLTGSTRG